VHGVEGGQTALSVAFQIQQVFLVDAVQGIVYVAMFKNRRIARFESGNSESIDRLDDFAYVLRRIPAAADIFLPL